MFDKLVGRKAEKHLALFTDQVILVGCGCLKTDEVVTHLWLAKT